MASRGNAVAPELTPPTSSLEPSGCGAIFHTRTRFIMMVLVLLCLASIWSNILSFNFAVICFIHNVPSNSSTSETSERSNVTEATQFTLRERSYLTSAVAASALVINFVVVALVNRYGIRIVFAFLGMLSALATLCLPTAIYWGYNWTLAARVVQGAAFASNFPVIGAFTSKWTYYKQNGLFVSVLVAYVQFAPSLTMPISGQLCESSWGWPSVFYCHGALSICLFLIFGIFYRNSPGKHPFVGDIERNKISVGKSSLSKKELRRIPYVPILTTSTVWAIWIAAMGNFVVVNIMFIFGPTVMNKLLQFPIHSSGLSAAVAPIAQFGLKVFAGFTSDKVRFLSESNKLRAYNSIAFFTSAIFLTVLAFTPTEQRYLCLVLFGCSAGALGFTTGGFFKAGPLVAKHYSHFVTGNISLGLTFTMLIVPFVVDGLTPNNTAEEWRLVFLFCAGTLVISNLLFVLMCSAEPAYWTTDAWSRQASKASKKSTVVSRSQMTPSVNLG
ncbi:hypothetical protein M3Y94_00602400 [Aphelenchoides besseyi]|nr:hypothetical protein M3Y94_00602400 [Aphelenchoides besseyi]KAI6222233.1 hypothetical protein M3Y95_00963100 [Aphelenchoides besseyi]